MAQQNADVLELVDQSMGRFRIRTEAYTSPEVFRTEMSQIFERVWIYVAHESELSEPGAYKTTYVGLQPVIVSRGAEGEINVLVNRCVHRGSVVCRDERGVANHFRCPYHGWVYRNTGELGGIPGRKGESGYGPEFDEPEGLFRLPRVESYRGLIFASFNPDVEDLVDHLGRSRELIDLKFDESPTGEIELLSAPYVATYAGNWKFQSENIVDGYHFAFVHEGFIDLQQKYGDATGDFGVHETARQSDVLKSRAEGVNWGCAQGHGLTFKARASGDAFLKGPNSDYYEGLLHRHGEERFLAMMGMGAGSLFPNFGIIHHQLRVWRPITPSLTEVTVYPYHLKGAPDEVNRGWLRSQERFYGPAGHGQPDDTETFSLNQQGLMGSAVSHLILERGLMTEQRQPDGDYRAKPSGEANQRAFWRRWNQLVTGD